MNVYFMPSGDTVVRSTICGLIRKLLVRAEQRVVHEIAVVARDVGGRPDRIEDLQIGLRHEAKGLPAVLGVDRRRAQRHGGSRRGRASDDLSATDAIHLHFPVIVPTQAHAV